MVMYNMLTFISSYAQKCNYVTDMLQCLYAHMHDSPGQATRGGDKIKEVDTP